MQLIITAGFLGAGKTTAISQAALYLKRKAIETAAITNDQGRHLVDTSFLNEKGIMVSEIAGGCFCCNFNELNKALSYLRQHTETKIVFAEPVGSCTDLVATVIKPLQQFYPSLKVSLTVFADAVLLHTFFLAKRNVFIGSVHYVYEKQLEEADILVVSKADLINDNQKAKLAGMLQKKYPLKRVLFQNSYLDEHIALWLQNISDIIPQQRRVLDIDYDLYGAGERELAWLDGQLSMTGVEAADHLIRILRDGIHERKWPIGHLKFWVNNGNETRKISFTSTGMEEMGSSRSCANRKVELLINARVQCDCNELHQLMEGCISDVMIHTGVEVVVEKMEYYTPQYPKPVYRLNE